MLAHSLQDPKRALKWVASVGILTQTSASSLSQLVWLINLSWSLRPLTKQGHEFLCCFFVLKLPFIHLQYHTHRQWCDFFCPELAQSFGSGLVWTADTKFKTVCLDLSSEQSPWRSKAIQETVTFYSCIHQKGRQKCLIIHFYSCFIEFT